MSPRHTFLFLLLCAAGLFASCLKDEDYTLSPNDVLTFSTDTVDFDTIISGTPTSTYSFTVYNRASKALRIPQIRLASGAASPFKVNVDGTPLVGGEATDFEIGSHDSLVVFLMANIPEVDSDLPVAVEDKLLFTTEAGVQQEVVLTASGQTVVTLTGHRVSEPTVFRSPRPYRIMDSLVVEAGQTLVLEAGTRLYFHPQARLVVHGSLQIMGTLDQPVMLRGDRMGNMFTNQPYDRIPGQWGGVVLAGDSYDNYFSYADIHSGSFGVRVDSSDVSRTKLVMENSVVHNTTGHGLDIRMAQVTNAGADCLHIRGGDITLVHTTIARFYVFTGGSGVALDFANYDGSIRLPIHSLQLANCIVTGYQNDEIMGSQNKDNPDDAFNYAFFNCLINTPPTEETDQRLVDCLWDVDDDTAAPGDTVFIREKNFTPAPDLDRLVFSFELDARSKAVGTANAEITASTYPFDRLGRPRKQKPDMGCLSTR